MTLSPANAVAFALTGGYPSDVREWITVELPAPTSRRRGYIVAVEPLTRTFQTLGLAKRARELISLQLAMSGPAESVVGRAFAAANAALCEERQSGDPAIRGIPVHLGATVALIEDEVATVAWVPPAQALIVQDGLVYGLPPLDSWLPDYMPPPDQAVVEPLGYAAWVAPRVVQTELRPGDSIVICSATFGETLARAAGYAGPDTPNLATFFRRGPDHALEIFRDLAIREDLTDAAIAVIGYPPLPSSAQVWTTGDVGRRLRERRRTASAEARRWLPPPAARPDPAEAMTAGSATGSGSDEEPLADLSRANGNGGLPTTALSLADAPVSANGVHADHFAGLRTGARSALDRLSPKWKATWQRPSPDYELGVPGAHGVQVYRGSAGAMGEPGWRNRLPRVPFYRAVMTTLIVCLCIVAAVVGGVVVKQQFFPDRAAAEAALAAVDQHMASAVHAPDATTRDSELRLAQESLGVAKREGADGKAVDARQQEITRQRDKLGNIIRFTNVTRLGNLPADLNGKSIEIVRTSSGIFIAGGGLYRLKPGSPGIVRVLKQGAAVPGGKQTVGQLWGVSVDVNGLYAVDGKHVFKLDNNGKWTSSGLGVIPGLQPWTPSPTGAFAGNIYLLVPNYRQVYKFPPAASDNQVSMPVDWVNNQDRTELNHAIDFVVDSNISILMDDGRVLTFYRGALAREFTPAGLGNGKPLALDGAGGDKLLYMLVADGDGQDGRIICFDPEGKQSYQLRLPPGFSTGDAQVAPPFANVRAFTVDEGTGTVYLFTEDAIWTATFNVPTIPSAATKGA